MLNYLLREKSYPVEQFFIWREGVRLQPVHNEHKNPAII
jgi:hypothetical protein